MIAARVVFLPRDSVLRARLCGISRGEAKPEELRRSECHLKWLLTKERREGVVLLKSYETCSLQHGECVLQRIKA